MGIPCSGNYVEGRYENYLPYAQLAQLASWWGNRQLMDIQETYQKGIESSANVKSNGLNFMAFSQVNEVIARYPEPNQRKLFAFCSGGQQYIDWPHFLNYVRLCSFCSTEQLGVLMFMPFDLGGNLSLTKDQFKSLLQSHEWCIRRTHICGVSSPNFHFNEIVQSFFQRYAVEILPIYRWLNNCNRYFDFNLFQSVLSIFQNEKVERQLIQHFAQINVSSGHGYVVQGKWFQCWCLYVWHHYSIKILPSIDINVSLKQGTRRITRRPTSSKGSIFSISTTTNKIKCGHKLIAEESGIHIDLVGSHIGDRPGTIDNNSLLGEYELSLKPELIQNTDYVILSEQAYSKLEAIYQGGPRIKIQRDPFTRLNSRRVRVFTQLHEGVLDTSQFIILELSCESPLNDIKMKFVTPTIPLQALTIFVRPLKTKCWLQITLQSRLVGEFCSSQILFTAVLSAKDAIFFRKKYLTPSNSIQNLSPGAQAIYECQGDSKRCLYLGRQIQGKHVLHPKDQSYKDDFLLTDLELIRFCRPICDQKADLNLGKDCHLGLQNDSEWGFLASCILTQIYQPAMKQFWTDFSKQDSTKSTYRGLLEDILKIRMNLIKRQQVPSKYITQIAASHFSEYYPLDLSCSANFLEDFACRIKKNKPNNEQNPYLDFTVTIQRAIFCQGCNKNQFYCKRLSSIEISLPEDSLEYFEVVLVPTQRLGAQRHLQRYGFLLDWNATIGEYKSALKDCFDMQTPSFIILEVHNYQVIKNYQSVINQSSLQQCKLLPSASIYAYQINLNYSDFIQRHFPKPKTITQDQLTVGKLVDCNNQSKWAVGKIKSIRKDLKDALTLVQVVHKALNNQQEVKTYCLEKNEIAAYPHHSYLNDNYFHLQLLQRSHNREFNSMEPCNLPLIIPLASWMLWQHFYIYIAEQIAPFIKPEYQGIQSKFNQNYQTNGLYQKQLKLLYKVYFSDNEVNCLICLKSIKSIILQGEETIYCEGCQLNIVDPVCWQIKSPSIMILLDWLSPDYWQQSKIETHDSCPMALKIHEDNRIEIKDCLRRREQGQFGLVNMQCCLSQQCAQIRESIIEVGKKLLISVRRVFEGDFGFRRSTLRQFSFPISGFQIVGKQYQLQWLIAVTSKGSFQKFMTYIRLDSGWTIFDGLGSRPCSEKEVLEAVVVALCYKLSK